MSNISLKKRKTIFERDNYSCLRCNRKDKLSIDHIIPLKKGGNHDLSNLQTLCIHCNSSKNDRIIPDIKTPMINKIYYPKQGNLDRQRRFHKCKCLIHGVAMKFKKDPFIHVQCSRKDCSIFYFIYDQQFLLPDQFSNLAMGLFSYIS